VITVIATALCTLAAAIVGGLMQHLTATRTTRAATAERRRRALAEAIPALLAAIIRYREHQYLKFAAFRSELPDTVEARQARYAARSAVTSAMDVLFMTTQDRNLLQAAQEAVDAATALGDLRVSPGSIPETEVDDAGLRARQAHTALREASAHYLYR